MKKIIIFGIGYHGRMAYRKIKEKKEKKKIIFIDNSIKKKSKIFSRNVFNPKILGNINFDKIILCGRYIQEQKKQLYEMGIKEKIIIWGRRELKPQKKILISRLKKYISILKIVTVIFKKNDVDYWADYSGLLAIIRGQNIAEMSDFDICFNSKDTKKIIKLLKKKVPRVEVNYNFYSEVKKKKFPHIVIFGKCNFYKMEPPRIDFVPRVFYNGMNEELKFDKNKTTNGKFWENYEEIRYKNLNIRVPINAKKYLKKLYGKSWKIEKNFWNARNS